MEDEPAGEDTIRCLIMTDNHVGYLERDPVRGDDSFRTFEECLQLARSEGVDCILHAGDLFHHNKPSRKTMVRTSELLKRYTFGERPVELELLSRAQDNFSVPTVNYMDPNLNVDIPVFAIHGNHDDPAGDGAYSAMDLLANVGLVNYLGKHQQVDNLQVAPVLLRKGSTKMALYGMGNVRDERLYRAFVEKRVQMLQPNDMREDELEELFSILLIHQNRAQHSAKNFVTELMLPEFLDLVVWGHEHECLVNPQQAAGRDFYVSQPGSSVATSLIEGESKSKHVAVLEINRGRFQLRAIPLTTVRPFFIEDFNPLAENVPKDAKSLHKALAGRIAAMVAQGKTENPNMLPLCRLRVELAEGYEKIPPQRFGAEFVGRVANPDDLILYSKKARKPDVNDKNARSEASILAARANRGGAKQSVEQEVNRILSSRAKHMTALPERHLNLALSEFVDKEDSKAFETMLSDSIKSIRSMVLKKAEESGISDLTADLVRSFAEERVKEEDEKDEPVNYDVLAVMGGSGGVVDVDELDDVAKVVKKEPAKKRAPAKKKSLAPSKKKKVVESDEDDDDDDQEEDDQDDAVIEVSPKKAAPKKAAVKRELPMLDLGPSLPKKAAKAVAKSPAKRSAAVAAAASVASAASQHFDDTDLSKPLQFRKKK